MLNKVVLVGEVANDPKSGSTNNGNATLNFSIKTTEQFKDKSYSNFNRVSCFGQSAMTVVNKGDIVAVEGRMNTRSYEQNGEKKYITEVSAMSVKNCSAMGAPVQGEDDVPY